MVGSVRSAKGGEGVVKRRRRTFRTVAAICVVVAAMAGCGGEADLPGEGSVTEDAELRAELTRVYGAVRKALAEYDLEAAKVHLDIPAGSPTPTRAQALAMYRAVKP